MSDPEFGPRGYLPDRAARRARKIVLRAPLGLQWVIASVVAGLVVLAAGAYFLVTRTGPPGEPYVAVGPVAELGDAEQLGALDVLVVTAGGRVRAFAGADRLDLTYCPGTRRIAGAGGRVYNLLGRGFGGVPSLEEHPTVVHEGVLYLDPTRTVPAPPPTDEPAEADCR